MRLYQIIIVNQSKCMYDSAQHVKIIHPLLFQVYHGKINEVLMKQHNNQLEFINKCVHETILK